MARTLEHDRLPALARGFSLLASGRGRTTPMLALLLPDAPPCPIALHAVGELDPQTPSLAAAFAGSTRRRRLARAGRRGAPRADRAGGRGTGLRGGRVDGRGSRRAGRARELPWGPRPGHGVRRRGRWATPRTRRPPRRPHARLRPHHR